MEQAQYHVVHGVDESLCDSFARQKSKISGDVNESKLSFAHQKSKISEDVDTRRHSETQTTVYTPVLRFQRGRLSDRLPY